ncbi:hypothetical protein B0T22DRAFT_113548 [Podospora appendiculata]|uniref:Uncharacterized protein n=1 Tax=Podospora appendiculata TaxID=314037 RepID=A0AAE0XLI4_9PEZI|nr:hypothetical protein B0T22DRAFT_113548 [Podospora appendiculata]
MSGLGASWALRRVASGLSSRPVAPSSLPALSPHSVSVSVARFGRPFHAGQPRLRTPFEKRVRRPSPTVPKTFRPQPRPNEKQAVNESAGLTSASPKESGENQGPAALTPDSKKLEIDFSFVDRRSSAESEEPDSDESTAKESDWNASSSRSGGGGGGSTRSKSRSSYSSMFTNYIQQLDWFDSLALSLIAVWVLFDGIIIPVIGRSQELESILKAQPVLASQSRTIIERWIDAYAWYYRNSQARELAIIEHRAAFQEKIKGLSWYHKFLVASMDLWRDLSYLPFSSHSGSWKGLHL